MPPPVHKRLAKNRHYELHINVTGMNHQGEFEEESVAFNLHTLDLNGSKTAIAAEFGIDAIRELYTFLQGISIVRDHSRRTSGRFLEVAEDQATLLLAAERLGVQDLAKFLARSRTGGKLASALAALPLSEQVQLESAVHHAMHVRAIRDLELMVEADLSDGLLRLVRGSPELSAYHAGKPETVFQRWFEANPWLFGVNYARRHDARSIDLRCEADLIFLTATGYADLIELKRPKLSLFREDESHGCLVPTGELAAALGQCFEYLRLLELNAAALRDRHAFSVLQPRVTLVAGSLAAGQERETKALRQLNGCLSRVEVRTFDDMLSIARRLTPST